MEDIKRDRDQRIHELRTQIAKLEDQRTDVLKSQHATRAQHDQLWLAHVQTKEDLDVCRDNVAQAKAVNSSIKKSLESKKEELKKA